MVPTGVLIGQITTVFTIAILGIWSATQWTAAQLGYQPRLGCLLYTSDAADERSSVDLGGRRIIKKQNRRERYRRHV